MSLHRVELHRTRSSGAALVGLAALLVFGCDLVEPEPAYTDDPCHPDYQFYDSYSQGAWGVIGPAGGVLTITDPVDAWGDPNPFVGVQLSVPAGAWGECWEVGVTFNSGNEQFPKGFVADRTGFVFVSIFRHGDPANYYVAPDSMYVELSFPIRPGDRGETELYSAFESDSLTGGWQVRLPDELNASMLTIQRNGWNNRFSWGRIDLQEIDFDTYLEPALEQQVGTEAWNAITAKMDSLHQAMAAEGWRIVTCVGLEFAEHFFEGVKQQSGDLVRALGASYDCGYCDATTQAFYAELRTYIHLNVTYLVVEILIEKQRFLVKLAGYGLMGVLLAQMYALDCDYPCLSKNASLPYYLYTGTYWASHLAAEAIRVYKAAGFIQCEVSQVGTYDAPTFWPAGWADRHPEVWIARSEVIPGQSPAQLHWSVRSTAWLQNVPTTCRDPVA
jgi:hypothetical protein